MSADPLRTFLGRPLRVSRTATSRCNNDSESCESFFLASQRSSIFRGLPVAAELHYAVPSPSAGGGTTSRKGDPYESD